MDKLEFYMLDAPVGSGKTEAAIRHMLGQEPSGEAYWGEDDPIGGMNFIYVAPTVRLVKSVHDRLETRASDYHKGGLPRLVAVVTQDETLVTEGSKVILREQAHAARNALTFINDIHRSRGAHVFLTTANFQNILSSIERPEEWCVFMDELVDAVQFQPYSLGENAERSESILSDLVEERADGTLMPTPLARRVADRSDYGHEYAGSRDLVMLLVNPSLSVRRLDGVRSGPRGESQLWYTCEPIPSSYATFARVIFASAIMRETLLYKLWTRHYGVKFEPVDDAEFGGLHDTHAHQGPLLTFHWLFAADEHASAYNLRRDRETLQPNGSGRKQIIDACVEMVDDFFLGPYALHINNWWKGHRPERAEVVPVKAEGLDDFSAHTDLALLAVTNPDQVRESWVRERLDIDKDETNRLFRLHTIYQGLGRIALRVRENEKPMRVVVLSKSDARYLSGLFDGSKLGGKVGNIPVFTGGRVGRPKPTRKLADNPEYQRLAKERKKYREQVKRAKTDVERQRAEERFHATVEALGKLRTTTPDPLV
jgi:hypothetical protein